LLYRRGIVLGRKLVQGKIAAHFTVSQDYTLQFQILNVAFTAFSHSTYHILLGMLRAAAGGTFRDAVAGEP
jgi:hypothetical protein